jgi:hypothetical protein
VGVSLRTNNTAIPDSRLSRDYLAYFFSNRVRLVRVEGDKGGDGTITLRSYNSLVIVPSPPLCHLLCHLLCRQTPRVPLRYSYRHWNTWLHLLHAHGPRAQSMPLGQTWLLQSDASRLVSVATASGYGLLPQLQPYRSQGHRGMDRDICLHGENRTLTDNPNITCTCPKFTFSRTCRHCDQAWGELTDFTKQDIIHHDEIVAKSWWRPKAKE